MYTISNDHLNARLRPVGDSELHVPLLVLRSRRKVGDLDVRGYLGCEHAREILQVVLRSLVLGADGPREAALGTEGERV